MNNDRASHWSKWSGGKFIRTVEIFPCRYAWFEGGLAQEVECEFRLVQYFSHMQSGNDGSTTSRTTIKCALNVRMALSAALR